MSSIANLVKEAIAYMDAAVAHARSAPDLESMRARYCELLDAVAEKHDRHFVAVRGGEIGLIVTEMWPPKVLAPDLRVVPLSDGGQLELGGADDWHRRTVYRRPATPDGPSWSRSVASWSATHVWPFDGHGVDVRGCSVLTWADWVTREDAVARDAQSSYRARRLSDDGK